MNLTPAECQALLVIINNARITGADAALVAELQTKLQRIMRAGLAEQKRADMAKIINPGLTE
jgi:hypothetical protein